MDDTKKRYYWIKLKEDFFKRNDIQLIEAEPNGKDYILFYLKILCESVGHEGYLRFSDDKPYTEKMFSLLTKLDEDTVKDALTKLTEYGMIEIMENGTILVKEIQNMTGSETTWAEKKRAYREGKKAKEDNVFLVSEDKRTMSDKRIDTDIDNTNDRDFLMRGGIQHGRYDN